MLRTILPLNTTLTELTDRARQRNYTYEEATLIYSSARLRELGCAAIDALRPKEKTILDAAFAAAQQACPSLSESGSSLIRESLPIVFRQAQFAMAADETDPMSKALLSLQPLFWRSDAPAEAVRAAYEALRSETKKAVPGYAGGRLDEYLKVSTRFLITCAEVGPKTKTIVDSSLKALFDRHNDLLRKYPDAEAKTRKDQVDYLMYAAQGLLPDGDTRIFVLGRTLFEAAKKAKFDPALMLDSITMLRSACRKNLTEARLTEFFTALRTSLEYVVALCDVAAKREAIVDEAQKTVVSAATNGSTPSKDVVAKMREPMLRTLDLCALGSVPGGQQPMIQGLEETGLILNRERLSARLVTNMFKALLTSSEKHLSALTLNYVQHPLHRATHYMGHVADFAEKGEMIFNGVVDNLEARYPQFFSRHIGARSYVIRDHEQVTYNLVLSLLPGSEWITPGRYQAFGEFLAEYGFDKTLMELSFELLEKAMIDSLEGQTLGFLLPKWKRVRRYLEAMVAIPKVYEPIIEEAYDAVAQKHAQDFARFENCEKKIKLDLKAMLSTAAVSTVPGGERILRRGCAHFHEAVFDAQMPPAMLDTAYTALSKAVAKHLGAPHATWIVPNIDRINASLRISTALAPKLDQICATVAADAIKNNKTVESQHPHAARRAAEDAAHTVKRCILALVPGGASWLAQGIWDFGRSVSASNYGAEFIPGFYNAIRKEVNRELSRESVKTLASAMDPALDALAVFAEVGEKEHQIVSEALNGFFENHPTVSAKYPDCRQKTEEDFRDAVYYAIMAPVPGGEKWVRHFARTQMFVYSKSPMDPDLVFDAYDRLAKAAAKTLSRSSKNALVPRLEALRDYLAITAGVASKEQQILGESVEALIAKLGSQITGYPEAQAATLEDEKLVLYSSAMALLPECKLIQAEVGEVISSVGRKSQFQPETMREAYELLQQSCSRHLKKGPVGDLNKRIGETAQLMLQ